MTSPSFLYTHPGSPQASASSKSILFRDSPGTSATSAENALPLCASTSLMKAFRGAAATLIILEGDSPKSTSLLLSVRITPLAQHLLASADALRYHHETTIECHEHQATPAQGRGRVLASLRSIASSAVHRNYRDIHPV